MSRRWSYLPRRADTALDLHRGVVHVLTASGLALVVHVGAMILHCGAVALVVDPVVGLSMLRRLWFNLDRVWAVVLVGVGAATLLSA
jgi:hypothetical protein